MRFKIRLYLLIIIWMILSFSLAQAQDPGIPDTIRVECKETVLPNSEFTLEVYIFFDSLLSGVRVPLTFYNSDNLDIYVDSIIWGSLITSKPPDIEGRSWHNEAEGDTAKTLLFGAVWFVSSLSPGQGLLATIYFHTGPSWNSTLYTKVDTITYYPGEAHLELYTPAPVLYTPKFVAGCLGPPPTPHMPQLQLPDTQKVNAGDTVEFIVIATDEDALDILTITKYGVGDFTTTPGPSPDTGFFSWATTDDDTLYSPYVDTFIVDDGTGLADTGFVVIIVNPFYHNPTLTFVPSPPYTLLGGDTLEFTVIAQDPDSEQILTIAKYGVGDFTTTPNVAPCSGFFFWATTLDDTLYSPYLDTFIVDDGTGLADTEIVSIEIFPYVPPAAYGDLNRDGSVDLADVIFLAYYIFKDGPPPTPLAASDINGDCFITLSDIIYLSNFILRGGPPPKPWCLPGDVNHDGYVNVPDVIYFINYLLKSDEEPESKNSTDVNADCKIDVVDLVYLISFLFRGGPIPEPGCVESLSLLLAKAKPETAELTLTDFVLDRTSEIIEISISAKFDVPIAGVQLEIGFDPQKLQALDPVLSSRSKALTLYHSTKQDYQLIGILDINLKNLIQPGDGTIITLRFKPKSESFDLSKIKIREAILVDPSAYELQVTINQETGSLVR